MSAVANYYSGNPLNRLSYLRTSPAFLASALSSPKAKFVLFNKLNPLVLPRHPDGSLLLQTLTWTDVKAWIGDDAARVFRGADGKDDKALGEVNAFWHNVKTEGLSSKEKEAHFINQPALVFLGVDERSAPLSIQSLPLSKPTDESTLESHSPHGVPFWALDTTTLDDLREDVLKSGGGEFTDMRAGMASISPEQAAIAGEGRALLDWNTRNRFCPSCARPLRSVWAGWKRACIPGLPSPELETPPTCLSKTGVHNFNYPRTDPVVIMAVISPDRESILLGRQRVWPKRFYSCLAGFIESGETIEEAVRREVYEEAGIEVGDVYYHSSQPWPYPSSLMIGAICIAKPDQVIRTDLDNELEDARWFPREEVLAVLVGESEALTKEEVSRFDLQQQGLKGTEAAVKEETTTIRLPASTAIAHTLVAAWATNSYLQGSKL